MNSYQVVARNHHTASENRIHSDDVARQFGFRGGLVPGVTVYAYMTHPVVEALGPEWLSHGTLSARFGKPVYDGERITVSFDGEAVTVVNPAGEACATGRAGLAAAVDLDPSGWPDAPLRDDRPAVSEAALGPAGSALGTIGAGFHAAAADAFLEEIEETLPVYWELAVAHPGWLIGFANQILTRHVRLGPWVHVSSDVTNHSPVHDRERLSVRGRVAQVYERKGHHLCDLDLLMLADDRPAATVQHSAIWRLRGDPGEAVAP